MNRSVLRWELGGVAFIIFVGSALHFAFAWSGHWEPLAVVAAVNESVWEHLKLVFWPGLMFAGLEFLSIRRLMNNFWVAKATALLVMPLVIATGFYSYSAILGGHRLAIDILLFVLSVAVGQAVSYRLANSPPLPPTVSRTAAIVLVLLIAAFSLLSYFPPNLDPWRDSATGGYGILYHP